MIESKIPLPEQEKLAEIAPLDIPNWRSTIQAERISNG